MDINPTTIHIGSGIRATIASNMNTPSMMNDTTLSEPSSEEDPDFDDSDLLNTSVADEVTAQLLSAGPVGVAAAAAIATAKKRKRPHAFETNPSVRKRQQTRLLRKLRATIDEYTTRVGQQAVVLCCTPGKTQTINTYRVFGSQPLENIIRNRRSDIMSDLEGSLAHQTPQQVDNPSLHELPPLNIDGIPTPVDKMTQAQLRAFIPEMLKYSTGRSKPGWGKVECRPMWWPNDVPWANVRSDVRSEEQKKKVSWTHALRTIVRNCYQHHNREDLLPEFHAEENHVPTVQAVSVHSVHFPHQPMVQTINNPDGTISVIQIDAGDANTPQVITLADGTQAQVVHTLPNGLHQLQDQGTVHTLAEVAATQQSEVLTQVEVNSVGGAGAGAQPTIAEASINSEGQLILSGDPAALANAGMVTIPVTMYQSVVTSLAQLGEVQSAQLGGAQTLPGAAGATLQVITPEQIVSKVEDGSGGEEDADTAAGAVAVFGAPSGEDETEEDDEEDTHIIHEIGDVGDTDDDDIKPLVTADNNAIAAAANIKQVDAGGGTTLGQNSLIIASAQTLAQAQTLGQAQTLAQTQAHTQAQSHVPDATQAVEVMSMDQS